MKNNSSLQKWDRLQQKTLNQQFINSVIHGMNCSNYEASAILDTVHEVYGCYFQMNGTIKPGQIQLSVVKIENSPKLKLSECEQTNVILTLFCDDDIEYRKQNGIIGLRQHQLERMCTEAFQQGGLLTVEDVAYRLLNCGERTLCRDIKALGDQEIFLPLRSTIKDMGRSISHRKLIVDLWVKGKEYAEIAREAKHSTKSIQNYIVKFKQIVALSEEGYDVHSISFLTQVSASLVEEYFMIYHNSKIVETRKQELENYLKKNEFYNNEDGR